MAKVDEKIQAIHSEVSITLSTIKMSLTVLGEQMNRKSDEVDAAQKECFENARQMVAKVNEMSPKMYQAEVELVKVKEKLEGLVRKAQEEAGEQWNKKEKQGINDMRSLQLSIQIFESNSGTKGPGFPSWREDIEILTTKAYPGMNKILKRIRFIPETVTEEIFQLALAREGLQQEFKSWSYKDVSDELTLSSVGSLGETQEAW